MGIKSISASRLQHIVPKPASINFLQIQEATVTLQMICGGNELSITASLKHGKTSTRISAWSQLKHSKFSPMAEHKNDVKLESLCFVPLPNSPELLNSRETCRDTLVLHGAGSCPPC